MTQPLERQQLSQTTALALISLLFAVVIISFGPICIRLSEQELSPNATIFNRLWLACLVFALWKGLNAARHSFSGIPALTEKLKENRVIILLVAMGMFSCANQIAWAWSLVRTSVANSSLLHNLAPLFTAIAEWLLLNRRFDARFIVGIAIAVVGTIALGVSDFSFAVSKLQGDAVALLSAMLLSGYLLTMEQLRAKFSATTILLGNCTIAMGLLLPIVLLDREELFPSSLSGWLAVVFLALTLILGHGFLAYSLKRLSSSFVAISMLLYPILTAMQAWILFSETLSWSEWLTFAIVLLGIYLAVSSPGAIKSEVS